MVAIAKMAYFLAQKIKFFQFFRTYPFLRWDNSRTYKCKKAFLLYPFFLDTFFSTQRDVCGFYAIHSENISCWQTLQTAQRILEML